MNDRPPDAVQKRLDGPSQVALRVQRGDGTTLEPGHLLDSELDFGEGSTLSARQDPVRVEAGVLALHLQLVHVLELLDLERRRALQPQGPTPGELEGRSLL